MSYDCNLFHLVNVYIHVYQWLIHKYKKYVGNGKEVDGTIREYNIPFAGSCIDGILVAGGWCIGIEGISAIGFWLGIVNMGGLVG